MAMELTFLGTGTSQGIPLIGCDCEVCQSQDQRDKRMRTSALVSLDGHNLLIDATPELRLQCLANDIRRVDACLITHAHADHIFGLDDLRRFNQLQGKPIPVYVSKEHRPRLEIMFAYALAEKARGNPDLPQLMFRTFEPNESFRVFDNEVEPLWLPHGDEMVAGYRIGGMAYCTDVSGMPEEMMGRLEGLDVLVLGALRPKPHPKHLSLDQAVELAERIGARQTYFVHMGHQIGHQEQETLLPKGIKLAYDGLKVTISGPN